MVSTKSPDARAPPPPKSNWTGSLSRTCRFLLKYTSRDSVELLGRGKGGVHEARNAIAQYDEQSPLYGLIVYRRRKFLIKYIPEGTSRLLQGTTSATNPPPRYATGTGTDREQPGRRSTSATFSSDTRHTKRSWRSPALTA